MYFLSAVLGVLNSLHFNVHKLSTFLTFLFDYKEFNTFLNKNICMYKSIIIYLEKKN